MFRFEREVKEKELIAAMLDQIQILNLGMNDVDGYPYVVPISYGYEMKEDKLIVYTHFTKKGKKVDLLKRDPHVSLTFSIFNDFPDKKYKGHYHDYRSVMAKGIMRMIEYKDDPIEWEKGYNLMYTCNHREIKPLSDRKVIPVMYIGVITCDMKDVTAKSEFPLRKVEDVPFINVYDMPDDETPFDISDIIKKRREERKNCK